MTPKHHAKLVHEGNCVGEVNVTLLYTDDGWSPYLSLEDAYKLDDMRDALRRSDFERATRLGRVYELTPIGG